ncbi:MAG TPA: hypothetical protein VN154_07645 [Rhizomicrobium sp.]|nr:hypothetical protein [Rhizomicrobium sp.]
MRDTFRAYAPNSTSATIASLSRFAWEQKRTLVTLEINPLAVGKCRTGVIALDATAVFVVWTSNQTGAVATR